MIRTMRVLPFLALPILASLWSFAPPLRPVGPSVSRDDEDEDEPTDGEEEEEEDRYFAVEGGDVYTGDGAVLRGATVLAKNGVIQEIGYDLYVPEEAEVLDASGMHVYPGFVAIESNANIVVAQGGAPQEDLGHVHGPDVRFDPEETLHDLAAELTEGRSAVEDSYDPFGQNLLLALATGITSTVSGDAAIKLKRGEIDGLVMREDYLASFSWSTKNPAGKRDLREKFEKASAWLRDYREWQDRPKSREEEKEPSDKGVDDKVLAVLRGEKRAKFNVNEQGDLLSLARLAQEFEFRPVIEGCVEGWTVADELGRAGAAAIVTPRDRRNKDEELVREGGSTIENAAILYRHGVQIAIIPNDTSMNMGGIMGRDLMHLPIEVGFAIRGGLPESAAIDAITVVPARLLGIAHRVGTLEVGKDCDLIVTDGDVLHYQTFVQYTVVDGKLVYDKQKELFFAHIRPRVNPEEVLDPGEEVASEPAADSEVDEEPAAAKSDDDAAEEDSQGADEDDDPDETGDDGR